VLVVAGGVAAALHVGKLPTAIPVLQQALHVSLVQAGFLLSLVQFAGMLLGLLAGVAADGLGLKRTMAGGLLLLGVASALGAFARSPQALMVLRSIEGLGFLLASMPAPGLIRRLVAPERINAALGMWGAYMPVGTAIALLCGPPVMHAIGWRGWWLLLAGIALAMSVLLWSSLPADPSRAAAGAARQWIGRLRQTLGSRGPWLVALSFAVYSAQWLSVIGFLPSMYAQAGLAAGSAGAATAFAALVNMSGNLAAGRLLQRGVPPQRLLRIGFAAMAVGALLAFSDVWSAVDANVAGAVRYAGVLMFSAVGGLVPGTLFSLAVRLAPGESTVSTTVGWMQQWSSIGQFCGPPIVAYVASFAGGWQWSGAVTGACAMVGWILTLLVVQALRDRADTISQARSSLR
jgi:MFS family permease